MMLIIIDTFVACGMFIASKDVASVAFDTFDTFDTLEPENQESMLHLIHTLHTLYLLFSPVCAVNRSRTLKT